MKRNSTFIAIAILLSTMLLSACNLPSRESVQLFSRTPTAVSITPIDTPTPITSLCVNLYQPNTVGDRWEYSGNTSATGAYSRTDTVTASSDHLFTVESNVSNVTYTVDYACNEAGLFAMNPIQQYLGVLLTGPDAPLNVTLTANSGISLPVKINPGDSWQQIADWDALVKDFSLKGRFVFDYTAVGYESITVPFGTVTALRVNGIIRIEVSGFRILAGTYETTFWMAPEVGIVKSEGTSHVPGVDFRDNLELNSFTSSR
jgi:hypothetical protein